MKTYKLLQDIPETDLKKGNNINIDTGYVQDNELRSNISAAVLALMLKTGTIEEVIEEKDWVPKFSEKYYTLVTHDGSKVIVDWFDWDDDETDNFRLKTNNVFRTKELAEARLKEIMEN